MRALIQKQAFDGEAGALAARDMQRHFGGSQLIHAHSPIAVLSGAAPADVPDARIYAERRVINVEHGLSLGGPRFGFQVDAEMHSSEKETTGWQS
jgi:hypothetical protein